MRPFIRAWPDVNSLVQFADQRPFDDEKRETLYAAWQDQLQQIGMWSQLQPQVEKIKAPDTYTLVTAHQPVLFGGPLYTIYKIASTIHLARKLNQSDPDKQFLPVFITGGEDHDKEEMNHLRLFGKKVTWMTEQSGSVGRFTSEGLDEVIDELAEILKEDGAFIIGLMKECFTSELTYARGYQKFIQTLFVKEGLLVLSMDDPRLKSQFKPILSREIFEQASQSLVQKTQGQLDDLGFKDQAFARAINLFFIEKNERVQIEPDGESFVIGDRNFDRDQMMNLLDEETVNFSPNVVMRPLYQEFSLPNIAYVGGGGELAYWIERKNQFEDFGIPFPILVRRNSVAWIDDFISKKMKKVGIELTDLKKEKHQAIKEIISEETELDSKVQHQKQIIQEAFETLAIELDSFDQSVATYTRAEGKKLEKTLNNIESKIIRAVKKREQDTVRHIERIYDHCFPNGGLQERTDNFLPYYIKFGQEYLSFLIENLDPLEGKFLFVIE